MFFKHMQWKTSFTDIFNKSNVWKRILKRFTQQKVTQILTFWPIFYTQVQWPTDLVRKQLNVVIGERTWVLNI